MPLPKSLVQPLRQGQLTVGSGWRAYFAPFNRELAVSNNSTLLGPTIYDLEVLNRFTDTSLGLQGAPAGWFDMGYIRNFKFTPGSKIGNVMTGYRGAIRAKYRAEVSEKIDFVFMEMSRTALRIASGAQVFNLLKTTAGATAPLGPSGTAAVPMGASGYLATGLNTGPTQGFPTVFVPAGSGTLFPAGTLIVVDQDYNNTDFGFIGDAGANVFPSAVTDVDFIRRTSDYIAAVKQVVASAATGQDALILNGPFVGGGNSATAPANTGPTAGAKVQAISGYVTREGGTYIAEWSGIFLHDTIDASQILFYYPRLSPDAFTGFEENNLQNATAMQTRELHGTYDALAFDDPLDGETVVRYGAYFPHTVPATIPQI